MRGKPYPHDRLMAKTVLRFIPEAVTPNQVTVLRMLLTPLVLWAISKENYDLGIPLFLFVAFTDAIDGSLARTRDQVTDWGKLWDPVADKLLIGSVALLMLYWHFPAEIAFIILGLEAAVLVGAYYRKRQGIIVSANVWGKFKMLTQVLGITLYLFALATGSVTLAKISFAVFGLAGVFAIASFYHHGL